MSHDYTEALREIEGEIAAVIPERPDEAWFRRFFGGLPPEVSSGVAASLNAPALELVRRGGKRWRPLLLRLCARAFGREDGALSLTPLVELVHAGTLIVDDIEDSSDTRRGGPAIHLMFGVDAAVNAGNLLYFLPLVLIDDLEAPESARLLLHSRYALHMRRLHLGQAMDIAWHRVHDGIPPVEEYLAMCALKTGVLARASAEFGAIAAGAGAGEVGALGSAWEDIGVAFQILDDVRNLRTGNPGKRRGDDIVEGKKSLPVILACAADPRARRALARCFEAARRGGPDSPAVEEAIGLIARTGAIDAAEARARAMVAGAGGRAAALVPAGPWAEALAALPALLEG